jgi:acetyl-CoA synthetase
MHVHTVTDRFLAARDFLLQHRTDYDTALRNFRWPRLDRFNWALDYFDVIAAGSSRPALHIIEEKGASMIRSFAELAADSNRVANYLRSLACGAATG